GSFAYNEIVTHTRQGYHWLALGCLCSDGVEITLEIEPPDFLVWSPERNPLESTEADDDPCNLVLFNPQWEALFPPLGQNPAANQNTPTRRKPGPKPTGDWYRELDRWLIRVAYQEPKRLHNVDALMPHARAFLDTEVGWSPAEDKELRAQIVD